MSVFVVFLTESSMRNFSSHDSWTAKAQVGTLKGVRGEGGLVWERCSVDDVKRGDPTGLRL